jgi:hypothetical protein
MNPEKLTQFSQNKLIPSVADEYLHHIIHDEMPHGLKKYMEYELFLRIQLKVGWGVSLSTACKGNLTDLRRILHLSPAKGNPK